MNRQILRFECRNYGKVTHTIPMKFNRRTFSFTLNCSNCFLFTLIWQLIWLLGLKMKYLSLS